MNYFYRMVFLLTNKKFLSLIIFIYSMCILSLNSNQIGILSSYTLDEPTTVGATYEAVARNEYRLRCGSNYATGVSICTSFSGLLDSIYLRVIGKLTGNTAIIDDSDYADPILQWFLIFKRGVFVCLMCVIFFLLLTEVLRSLDIPFFTTILLIHNTGLKQHGFEAAMNAEMGLGLAILFLFYLRQLQFGAFHTNWQTVLTAIIATFRAPLIPFALLNLKNKKSFYIFSFVFLILMAGIFRSNFELYHYFLISFRASSIIGHGYSYYKASSIFDKIFNNLKLIIDHSWILFPFAIYGFIQYIYKAKNYYKNFISFMIFVFLLSGILFTQNSDPRFFIGFTAVFLIFSSRGLTDLFNLFISIKLRKIFLLSTFPLLLALIYYNYLNKNINFSFPPKYHLSHNEKILTNLLLNTNETIYLDKRLRFNLKREPLLKYTDRIKIFDPLLGGIVFDKGTTLVTLCYPIHQIEKLGIEDFSFLKNEIQNQCRNDEILNADLLYKKDNYRIGQSSQFNLKLVVLKQIQSPLNIKAFNVKKNTVLSAGYFQINNNYIQEWLFQVSNQLPLNDKVEFSMEKNLNLNTGKYTFSTTLFSRFRNDHSKLFFLLDGKKISECNLNTINSFSTNLNLPKFIHESFMNWFWRFFPVQCSFQYQSDKPSIHNLKLLLHSSEKYGQARFNEIEVKIN